MESHLHCVFGLLCPSHGLQCSCDLGWTTYDSTEDLSWGIEVQPNGRCIYYCFDRNNRLWIMCREHFLIGFEFTKDFIDLIIEVGHDRIRYTPEE